MTPWVGPGAAGTPCGDFSWPDDWVREAVGRANAALADGDWLEAEANFAAVLDEAEAPEALEGLATAAWHLGQPLRSFTSAEQAYLLYRNEDDRIGAARIAVRMAWRHTSSSGERAAANGWAGRARRLLQSQRVTTVHGWLILCQAADAIFVNHDVPGGKPASVCELGREAVVLGQDLNSVELEIAGVALEGVGLVSQGATEAGLHRLDEAGAALVTGELTEPAAIEFVAFCVVHGCTGGHDAERAMYWFDLLHRLPAGTRLPTLLASCDPARTPLPDLSPLTARERAVLDLVSKGLSNRDIAKRLILSEHTVHRHVANIRTKLGVSTRAAAVAALYQADD